MQKVHCGPARGREGDGRVAQLGIEGYCRMVAGWVLHILTVYIYIIHIYGGPAALVWCSSGVLLYGNLVECSSTVLQYGALVECSSMVI